MSDLDSLIKKFYEAQGKRDELIISVCERHEKNFEETSRALLEIAQHIKLIHQELSGRRQESRVDIQ